MCDYVCDYVLFDRVRSLFFVFFQRYESIICDFCILFEINNGIICLQIKPIFKTNQSDLPNKSIRFV